MRPIIIYIEMKTFINFDLNKARFSGEDDSSTYSYDHCEDEMLYYMDVGVYYIKDSILKNL